MTLHSVIFWLSRGLALLLVLSLVLISLDAFDGGRSFWASLGGFAVHLIPAFVTAFALLLVWKRGMAGGMVFAALALIYLALMHTRPLPMWMPLFSFLLLVAALFLLHGYLEKHERRIPQR